MLLRCCWRTGSGNSLIYVPRRTRWELQRFSQIARNTLRKDQRMNIRISKADLNRIKARAVEEGIPYQTLVKHYPQVCFEQSQSLLKVPALPD
jgi:hypothetical protein